MPNVQRDKEDMALIGRKNVKDATSIVARKDSLKSGDLLITRDNKCLLYISDRDWRDRYKDVCRGCWGKEGIMVLPSSIRYKNQSFVEVTKRYDNELKCKDFPGLDVIQIYREEIDLKSRTQDDWDVILSEYRRFIKSHGYANS